MTSMGLRRLGKALLWARRLIGWGAVGTVGVWTAALYAASRSRPAWPDQGSPEPPPGLPPARIVHVPGRGEFFVREAPGPSPDAPVLVLLHGWIFPSDLNWFSCYGPLSQLGRVIAVDNRGHGRGPRPSDPFRLADVADDVAALLDHLGTGPAIAVGYSLGGTIAQLLWQRHPEAVRGLVLCATSAAFTTSRRDELAWKGLAVLQLLLRLVPRFWWERAANLQAQGRLRVRITHMINANTPPEVLERLPWIIGEIDRGSAEDVAEAGRQLSTFDSRGWIGTVDVPTAVLLTCRDELISPANQRDLARRIRDVHVIELDMDHDAAVSGGALFTDAISAGVANVVQRSAPEAHTIDLDPVPRRAAR